MTEEAVKEPAKIEPTSEAPKPAPESWSSLIPFKALKREVERLFEDFDRGSWRSPFRSNWSLEPFLPGEIKWASMPSVDVAETDGAFKLTAELPGMDEKNVEVTVADNVLTISGEKTEAKEETQPAYHVQERHYGKFERKFPVPAGVDAAQITATFKNGVLTVVLPKMAEAKKPEQKIEVKPA